MDRRPLERNQPLLYPSALARARARTRTRTRREAFGCSRYMGSNSGVPGSVKRRSPLGRFKRFRVRVRVPFH
jgi:hypothetical protein